MQVYPNNVTRLLRRSVLVPSSRFAQPAGRRHVSWRPVEWLRETISPGVKEAQPVEEVEAAKEQAKKEGVASLFEESTILKKAKAPKSAEEKVKRPSKPKPDAHKYSTANFKISHRKLNMLGQQIAGKPIDYAILQMQFSEKRASKRVMNMLATARDHAARYKRLDERKLVVAEAWVTKGARPPKRLEARGRGHYGTRTHFHSKISVVLKEGKTMEEQKAAARKRKLNRIVSAAIVREDKPIRNPSPTWGW